MITPVSRVRTCIIGAGDSARKHIVGWQAVNDAKVVAVVDVDETRAFDLAQEFGIEAVSNDYREVLARPDINIVSVCTPTVMHGPIGLDAVDRHKHVFCERSITHMLDECDALLAAARRNRVAVGMCFPRRFTPSLVRIRDMANESVLGRPLVFRVHSLRPAFDSTRDHNERKGTKLFLDLFADHYDLWTWLFRSEVTKVTARGFNWAKQPPNRRTELAAAPDTGVALIEFESGDLAAITAFCGMPTELDDYRVHDEELVGPQGVITAMRVNRFTHGDHLGRTQEHTFTPQDAHTEAIRDFANRIRRGEPPRVSGDDGRRALRIGLAICESMELGETIAL